MRSILIGIDGAEPKLIEKWVDELPNLQKFIYGKIKTTLPPSSAPAWTSIFTGVSPAKHGIYDFFYFDNGIKIVSSKHRRMPAIWNLLSNIGKRSIIINVPVTYPPEKINGVIVSGLLTPLNKNFVMPKESKAFLNDYKMEHLIIDDLPIRIASYYEPEKVIKILNEWIESRTKAFLRLAKNFKWDFAAVVYRATDLVQHFLWNEKEHVFQIYKKIDEEIGKIMKFKANYFISSDHGFYGIKKLIFLNNLLHKEGYLVAKKSLSFSIGKKFLKFFKYMPKNFTHLPFIKKILFSIASKEKSIDFSSSKAFCLSSSSRAIIVRQEVKKDVIRFLNEFSHNGKKPMKAYDANKIYGKNCNLSILIDLKKGYAINDLLNFEEIVEEPKEFHFKGEHSKYGIFMAYGKNFKEWDDKINVIDVMPTILHSMELPIPKHVDGKVIDLFKKEKKIRKVDWERYGMSLKELLIIRRIAKQQL